MYSEIVECLSFQTTDYLTCFCFSVIIYGSFSVLVHLTEVDNKLPFSSTSMYLLVEVAKVRRWVGFLQDVLVTAITVIRQCHGGFQN